MPTPEQNAWVRDISGVDPDSFAHPVAPGAPPPPKPGLLADAADWTLEKASAAAHAIGAFDDAHGHVLTRAAGAAQMVGGLGEAAAGAALAGVGGVATGTGVGAAPGIPAMVGGGALAVNGADNAQAGLRTLVSGEFHHTLISQAAGAGARALGASEAVAEKVTNAVDLTQGVAGGVGSIAVGMARKGATAGLSATVKIERAGAEGGEIGHAAPHPPEIPPAPPVAPLRAELKLADALSKAPKGSPERAKLIEEFAQQSTHVKPPPDRVVLGKWQDPGKGGYIDEARANGGVWYETPDGSYPLIGGETAWETNVAFLRQQMASGIPKLEFANIKISRELEEETLRVAKGGDPLKVPARVKEIRYLQEHAAEFGYSQVGDAFVKLH